MSVVDVKVPNIGDFKNVPVIEVLVGPGEDVKADDPLITLESDKAAMEVPAPFPGRVSAVLVAIGDKVSEGSPILKLDVLQPGDVSEKQSSETKAKPEAPTVTEAAPDTASGADAEASSPTESRPSAVIEFDGVHASPSVRRTARELDVDLTKVTGTGEKGRITKDDVKRHIAKSAGAEAGITTGIPEIPAQDFSKFGTIEIKPLSRLKKLAGPHLHRAWLNVPHVTNSDEADITDLDAYRRTLDEDAKAKGYRVTLVSFLLKASVTALKEHPDLNASLAPAKDALILKKYYNFGVAVDTPDGLVVPVIKDVDRKGILELSQELTSVSARMREGRVTPADIQGGTFSISSLGGIGGTNFTPIVNAPEVAILGALRASIKPVWDGTTFKPRLILPLCVSYDHRAVDGVLASRFLRTLAEALGDIRQLVL
jgi:pyruvate dehydrogenase E2 component (dihydrolipoamide acetyltransferase)